MANKITNITEMRNDLIELYQELRDGTANLKYAKEINRSAANVIASLRVQVLDHQNRKESPEIPFLK